jgi:DeoR family fructose operon transcriptional repressor
MENKNQIVFVEERRDQIFKYIESVKKATVSELSIEFNVSTSTVRTDLLSLENKGLIHRTHGGALSLDNIKVSLEPLPTSKQNLMIKQKKEIANSANRIIEDGDTIAICTGTTTMELAKTLINKKNLTIVVNDIKIANWLENNTDHVVYVIGGIVRRNFHYVSFTSETFPLINIDKAFFTCNGLNVNKGATIPDFMLAENIRMIINHSNESCLLCDSSKFGHVSFVKIIATDEIDKIIVDKDVKQEHISLFSNNGFTNLIISS